LTGAAVSKLRFRVSERASLTTIALGLMLDSPVGVLAQEAAAQEGAAPAAAAPTAPAAAAPQVVVQPRQQDSSSIEEIIVTGQRSFNSLIREAGIETENFYARLNEVLDIPDFEITCRNEYPTGSNISVRRCRMRYQEELDSRAALSAIQGMETITDIDSGEATGSVFRGTPYDILPEARQKMQEFETVVVEAVNSDPQLNASVVRLMQLKAAVDNYESTRQEERREREAADDNLVPAN
jgi:hypothetical protein